MNQRYITLCLLQFNYEGNVPLADPIERCPYCLRIEFVELGQFSVDTFTSEVDGTDVSTVYLTGVLYDGGGWGVSRDLKVIMLLEHCFISK